MAGLPYRVPDSGGHAFDSHLGQNLIVLKFQTSDRYSVFKNLKLTAVTGHITRYIYLTLAEFA